MLSLIKRFMQYVRSYHLIKMYKKYSKKYKVNHKQVLFFSTSKHKLSANFKYIYEFIKDDYKVEMLIENKPNQDKLAYLLATSSYILVDDYCPLIYPITFRKESKLIQIWHALGAFKTIGYARASNKDKYSYTHKNYDYAIVSSSHIIKDYAKAFGINENKILPLGIPRTDLFFNKDKINTIKQDLYTKYPQLKNKKIILFAPTFRGNNIHEAYYDFNNISFNKIKNELNDDYRIIIKMHPFIKNTYKETLDSSYFIDLKDYEDINELLLITDILITDYSSVIFEASLLNIHTIFFTYDLNEYIKERDFFYDFNKYTYGEVVYNDDMLIKAIKNNKIDYNKLNEFKTYFIENCDGLSSQRFKEVLLGERNEDYY